MPAPEGNQFWKLQSKHGREKLFADPALLWDAAAEYFEWVDANPWMKIEQMKRPTVTKDKVGDSEIQTLHSIAELPNARPYTIQGFCLYCGASREWWTKFKGGKDIEAFLPVISRIEEIIYTQKFEGAVVGAFNANIISRDLGLADKVEQVSEVTVNVIRKRLQRPDHDA